LSYRVFLHTPEPISAAARYITELATALNQRGVDLDVICPANHQFRRELQALPGVRVHLSAVRSIEACGFWRKAAANARFLISSCALLVRCARRGDLVHFQYVLHFPFGALFFLISRLRGLRIVFTVHDPVPHKWLLPPALRWISRAALQWAYNTSEVLVVHSEGGKKALTRHFGQSPERITVIVHGPYPLQDGPLAMPDSARLELLLFGALRENKGVHLAIRAVQSLHGRGVPVRLTIAGRVMNRNEREYWERCRQLIAAEPEPICLREEFISDEQLPDLFLHSHCLLLPYTNFASDSGVAFMALASGRTIIATRAGGLGALLDAAGGIAIEEPTVEAVGDAIRRALRLGSPELARLGVAGAAHVLSECGWPKVARDTQKVYEALAFQS
jgi:glycosyltransferase involved in cell wall biosynthesis